MTQDNLTTVFVYGTLKHGYGNNRLLLTSKFIGKAVTCGKFLMLDGGFPVLLEVAGTKDEAKARHVRGEVYEVDDYTLERLDRLESKGSMYDREVVQVRVDGRAEKIEANIYVGCDYWRNYGDSLSRKVDRDGNFDWQYGGARARA